MFAVGVVGYLFLWEEDEDLMAAVMEDCMHGLAWGHAFLFRPVLVGVIYLVMYMCLVHSEFSKGHSLAPCM